MRLPALFLLITLSPMPLLSMNTELQPLVKHSKQILVLLDYHKTAKISVDDTTTVGHIKKLLESKHNVSTNQQSLFCLSTSWRTLWLTDQMGSALQNSQKIRTVMENNNSHKFLLISSKKETH